MRNTLKHAVLTRLHVLRSAIGMALLLLIMGAAPRPAPPRDPAVRFVPLAKLDGFILADYHGGWSPTGPLLLLNGRGGEYVWDARKPHTAPVHLRIQGRVRMSAWSPSGDRILFIVGDANPKNLRTLLVAKADGSPPDTLVDQVDCWPATWGSDASIYYRTRDRLHRIEPRASWSVPKETLSRKTAVLLNGFDRSHGRMIMRRISPDGSETDLAAVNRRFSGDIVSIHDEVLETDRHLLLVAGRDGGAYVIDGGGAILHELHDPISANSISRDGHLVAGGEGIVADDMGQVMDTLRIADLRGNWCVPLTGGEDGAQPQLARTDSLIAFNAPHGGVIVGRYEIRRAYR